jgi:hypothetical protein
MNPNTGKMHPAMTDAERDLFKQGLSPTMKRLIDQAKGIAAEDIPEAGLKKGDPFPADWPQFGMGELIPIKGFHFKLERIEQPVDGPALLVLKCAGMTKAEKRRRTRCHGG